MSTHFIYLNNELVPATHPIFAATHRAWRYGDSLFESMRMVNGVLKFADLHADRLRRGMKVLKIEGQFDAAFLQDKVQDLSRRNKLGPNVRARLTVYRDSQGLYAPDTNQMGWVLELSKTDTPTYELNTKGLLVDVFSEITKPAGALSSIKSGNALVYVLAGIYKSQHRLDEVFILNQAGFLCEANSSNVFVVYDKKIYTPSLQEGCIAGVMRQVVIGLAKKHGFEMLEAQVNPAILAQADEVFLTNASRGIQWVLGYNHKRYFNSVSKFLSEELTKL
ncbi:MAG: aminotransferase class IV [Sphingobacteriaceae bacterium]